MMVHTHSHMFTDIHFHMFTDTHMSCTRYRNVTCHTYCMYPILLSGVSVWLGRFINCTVECMRFSESADILFTVYKMWSERSSLAIFGACLNCLWPRVLCISRGYHLVVQ